MLILQADRDSLLKPLQAVTGIVERRHTLPILSNVLLEAKTDRPNFWQPTWKSNQYRRPGKSGRRFPHYDQR